MKRIILVLVVLAPIYLFGQIGNISNGESGLSVRGKLNQVIDSINNYQNVVNTKVVIINDSVYIGGVYISSVTYSPSYDTIIADVGIISRIFTNKYQAFAYEDPDSVIVTSLTTSWAFLGGGGDNKFSNILVDGFSFDGDTLMFDQGVDDTRDSIQFVINYGGQSATSSVNESVYNGIFIKGALESTYTEYRPCTKISRTTTADVYYTGPTCNPTPIWLKDGDKIQIRARCAETTTTLSTTNFSIYLCER